MTATATPTANLAVKSNRPEHVLTSLIRDFDVYGFSEPNAEAHLTIYQKTREEGMPPIFWTPHNGGHWVVTRGEDIDVVVNDAQRFSNRYVSVPKELNPVKIYRPFQQDPPDNGPFRNLLAKEMSPRVMRILGDEARKLTIKLIEGFKARGECEFVSEFAEHMPIGIFMTLVGVPQSERENLIEIAGRIGRPKMAVDRMQGYEDMDKFLERLIKERRSAGQDDFTSRLANTEVNGRKMDDEELLGVLGLVFIAGLDTVVGMLGHIVRFLAQNPDRRHELRENRQLVLGAVEEMLRRFAHTQLAREVREDLEIRGVRLKKGDMVVAPLVLYNLDETKFVKPFSIDFTRRVMPPNLAFGGRAHRCLGAMLARTEIQIFLEEWLDRIPDFSIRSGETLNVSTRVTWVNKRLPLVWSPQV
jgi:cytochrome P450